MTVMGNLMKTRKVMPMAITTLTTMVTERLMKTTLTLISANATTVSS
jgi:uncharacterized membrane protein (UPF0136 family)